MRFALGFTQTRPGVIHPWTRTRQGLDQVLNRPRCGRFKQEQGALEGNCRKYAPCPCGSTASRTNHAWVMGPLPLARSRGAQPLVGCGVKPRWSLSAQHVVERSFHGEVEFVVERSIDTNFLA